MARNFQSYWNRLEMSTEAEELDEPVDGKFDVIVNLARGMSFAKVARRAGVNPRTIARWMEKPDFAKQVSDYRHHLLEAAASRLTGKMDRAISKMCELLKSPDDAVALRAAQGIINLGVKTNHLFDIQQKLVAIMAKMDALKKG